MHTALVAAGAGAKIAYQLGYISALQKAGIRFHSACGVSAGAIVAAAVATDRVKQAVTMVRMLSADKVFRREPLWSLANPFDGSRMGVYDQREPLTRLFKEFFEGAEITMPLTIGAVDYCGGQYRRFLFDSDSNHRIQRRGGGTNGFDSTMHRNALVESLLATSAIPGAFHPVRGWIDGGVRHMTPIGDALAAQEGDAALVARLVVRDGLEKGHRQFGGARALADALPPVAVNLAGEIDVPVHMRPAFSHS